ncbi:MAG: hypothetical protein LBU42_07300 [Prevotellaceae bacterium]|nr:hypothetical protein [Prevotellaceae bacterium]
MKKLLLLILFLPAIATAQWSVTPEVGVLFSGATSEDMEFRTSDNQYISTESLKSKFKTGYSFGCKVGYRILFGLKFSSGIYYTNESYDFTSGWYSDDRSVRLVFFNIKYGSLSMPVLLGYEHYFGKVLLSANAGAAYNYGLTLFVGDEANAFPTLKGRNAVNIIADIGGGYKISERFVLKLMFDYSQRMGYFKFVGGDNNITLGKPYHIGVKAGVEILL